MEQTAQRNAVQIALLLALAAATGCGEDAAGPSSDGSAGTSSTVGAPPPTRDDEAFISDFCAALVPCCTTNHLSNDGAVCKTSMRKLGMSRDAQLRSACLDELRERAESPACAPDPADFGDPCSRIFNEPGGPRAPGQACTTHADCAGSPQTLTNCNASICVRYSVGVVNDYPCLATQLSNGFTLLRLPALSGTNTVVSDGFVCRKRDGLDCNFDNRCYMLLPGGSPCTAHDACASRLCDGLSTSVSSGFCRPLPSVGQVCDSDCAGDNHCDATAQLCVAKLAPGAACTREEQCSGACEGSDLCSGTCVEGTCLPTNGSQGLSLGVWCGQIPVSG